MATTRDMQRLQGVHPTLVMGALKILTQKPMFVVCGVRTAEEQHARFLQVPKVTNCDGYKVKSNHQLHADGYGHAVDFAFLGPDPFGAHQDWHGFGILVESLGLTWGGRFHSPIDLDHAELP